MKTNMEHQWKEGNFAASLEWYKPLSFGFEWENVKM